MLQRIADGAAPWRGLQRLKAQNLAVTRGWPTPGASACLLQGSYEERLASFLSNQIRTDTSPVYGDGYRAALDAYQRLGLPALLAHLRQTGRLPT